MPEERRRKSSTTLLIAALVALLLLLCALLWIYQSFLSSPAKRVVEGSAPGVTAEFGAYQYRDSDGVLVDLKGPVGVAYDGDNRIYVSMPDEQTIVVFDADGSNGRVFVQEDTSEARASVSDFLVLNPRGVDVGPNGELFVACSSKAAVVVFASDGTKLREIPVMEPRYVRVHDELVYVLGKGTLYVLDIDGAPVGQYGTFGRGTGQLSYPGDVCVADDGTILIADSNNYRLVALSPDLEPLWVFGKPAWTSEEQAARILSSPFGIAVGGDGNTYVTDSLLGAVRVFDSSGTLMGDPLGEMGGADNQFSYPAMIDLIEDDLFVLADWGNNRVLGVRMNPVGDARVTAEQSQEDMPAPAP